MNCTNAEMKSFLDTNILVYMFDRDSPVKRATARKIFRSEGAVGNLVLSTQVLQEFYVSVTRKLAVPLRPESAYRTTRHLSTLPLVAIDSPLVLSAIRRSQQLSLSFWDALIVESARLDPKTCNMARSSTGFGLKTRSSELA